MRWFFFGSLLDPDVLALVVGRQVPVTASQPAVLHGYQRVCVHNESYPALRPLPGAQVSGQLVDDLDEGETRRICFFEGDEFSASPCYVTLADGAISQALAFLTATRLELLDQPWDFHRWRDANKMAFLDMTRAFMAGFGTTDWHQLDSQWRAAQRRLQQEAQSRCG